MEVFGGGKRGRSPKGGRGSLVRGGEGGRRGECEGLELRGVLIRDGWEEVMGAAWRRLGARGGWVSVSLVRS